MSSKGARGIQINLKEMAILLKRKSCLLSVKDDSSWGKFGSKKKRMSTKMEKERSHFEEGQVLYPLIVSRNETS